MSETAKRKSIIAWFCVMLFLSCTFRSPSPEPIYSYDGKRLNTREVRVKKRLEDERHRLVLDAMKINPDYKPPADYK